MIFIFKTAAQVIDLPEFIFEADLYIIGEKTESTTWPPGIREWRMDMFWKYQLPKVSHEVRIVIKNPKEGFEVRTWEYLFYSDKPANVAHNVEAKGRNNKQIEKRKYVCY